MDFVKFKRTMARLDAQLKKEEATRKARKEAKNKSKDKKNQGRIIWQKEKNSPKQKQNFLK